MALHYELTAIQDFEETCFVGEDDDAPLNPVTEALILSTVITGMPRITEDNYKEFFLRLQVQETLYGAPIQSADGGTSFTLDDIIRHIGLKTNATAFTKAKFNSNVGRIIRERAEAKVHETETAVATV